MTHYEAARLRFIKLLRDARDEHTSPCAPPVPDDLVLPIVHLKAPDRGLDEIADDLVANYKFNLKYGQMLDKKGYVIPLYFDYDIWCVRVYVLNAAPGADYSTRYWLDVIGRATDYTSGNFRYQKPMQLRWRIRQMYGDAAVVPAIDPEGDSDVVLSGVDVEYYRDDPFGMLAVCDGFEAALEGYSRSDTCHRCAWCNYMLECRRALCAEVRAAAE